jgi:beta-mannanase
VTAPAARTGQRAPLVQRRTLLTAAAVVGFAALLPAAWSRAAGSSSAARSATPVRTWLAGYAGDGSAAGKQAFAAAYFPAQVWVGYDDWPADWPTVVAEIATVAPQLLPATGDGTTVNVLTIGLVINQARSPAPNPLLLQSAAGGADATNWTAIGTALAEQGLDAPSTVLRIGHEPNGSWYPWATHGDPTLMGYYRQAWAAAAAAVRAVCPRVRFDLCLNAGTGGTAVIAGHYPGDAYVDILGLDSYDFATATTPAGFAAENTAPGFAEMAAFAAQHGKRFALDEWGLNGTDTDVDSRDNPFYVQQVFDTLTGLQVTYPGLVAWDAYFDQADDFGLAANPRSAALYKTLWTTGAAPASTTAATQAGTPVVVDRGDWTDQAPYGLDDRVTHHGTSWYAVWPYGLTGTEPGTDPTRWSTALAA